jgi:hypothetical protein
MSLLIGIIGYLFAGALGGESLALLGAIVGFFSPGIFILEKIYNEVKKSEDVQ